MKPANPIELLVSAIATQEDNWQGTNPGNLRMVGQPHASGRAQSIANFSSDQEGSGRQYGVLALYRDVLAKAAMGLSIRQIIAIFAPPSENDTQIYIRNVLEWIGLPGDVPLVQLIPEPVRLNLPQAPST
jgi:hypothetical protein